MSRAILDEQHIHPAIRADVADYKSAVVREVQTAIATHDIVVVGMRQNPFPKKALKLLASLNLTAHYIEHGSYVGGWRERLALKMWAGWATFPMVFVKGVLVGGAQDLQKLADAGDLQQLVAAPRP